MRYLVSSTLALAVLLAATTATTAEKERAAKGKIRVLLTSGGHNFEQEPFYAMFDAMSNVEYTKAEFPKAADLLKPGLEKKFDVIVMYDMVPRISAEQQKAFVALLKKGIGLVSLHHNMGAHRDWDQFRRIIGGKFFLAPTKIGGKEYPKSGWEHDQQLKVTVTDQKHPITKGLKDFDIHDEVYNNYFTAPKVKVLLKTDHPKNDPELAWVKRFGNSRVFYFMLGHDRKAYENENFREIVARGIRWAAGPKKAKR
ncbi:MAG: ThuA domain-containing protein [Planctomycetota bacterium]|jgi:type 1 glutamine amidotransferase